MLGYFEGRAIPGVECVSDGTYRRTVAIDGDAGVIELSPGGPDHLLLTAHLPHWEGHLDAERAASFYAELFGWVIDEATTPAGFGSYLVCRLRGRDVAAIRPTANADVAIAPTWMTHIWVESAEETARKAIEAGGRVVIEPSEGFDGGRTAILADPSGAWFGVWQPGAHGGAQLVNEPGAWTWSGLTTGDPEVCKTFYAAVFGWDTAAFGESLMWRVRGYVGGQLEQPVARDVVAGMVPMRRDRFPEDAQPRWGVDFWVDDADAIADSSTRLGGRIISPPFDTAVGRTAALADPEGAEFSVSRIGPPA